MDSGVAISQSDPLSHAAEQARQWMRCSGKVSHYLSQELCPV